MTRLFATVLLCAGALAAQFTPIVAKHREVSYLITPDGKKTVRKYVEGVFLRSSNGMELETKQRTAADPRGPAPAEAIFTDATTGKVYRVDYASKVKFLLEKRALPLKPHTDFHRMLGEATYNGMRCALMPVTPHVEGTFHDHQSTACISKAYDVIVYMEFARTGPDGRRADSIIENYDFQVGVEPPTPQFTEVVNFEERPNPQSFLLN